MAKRKKTWGQLTKVKRVRTGRRVVSLAAILATGAGAHSKRDERKLRNAPYKEEW